MLPLVGLIGWTPAKPRQLLHGRFRGLVVMQKADELGGVGITEKCAGELLFFETIKEEDVPGLKILLRWPPAGRRPASSPIKSDTSPAPVLE